MAQAAGGIGNDFWQKVYLDQSHFQWLWKILTNRYQGWGYAATHLAITVYIAFKILPEIRYRDHRVASRAGTAP